MAGAICIMVAKKTQKKQGKQKKSNTLEIPFFMIPAGDRQKVRELGLGLQDYWLDCWEADAYGSRWVLMSRADLKNTTDAKYRKQLEELGLFAFKKDRVVKAGRLTSQLFVINLHGSRRDNWRKIKGYKRFLKSDEWKAIRKEVLERDKFCCQECGSKTALHVHHLHYKHHRNEINHLEDLVTLCRFCHEKKHPDK